MIPGCPPGSRPSSSGCVPIPCMLLQRDGKEKGLRVFVQEKTIQEIHQEDSLGKNLKAGTSSRRERLEGPSCRLGNAAAFPRWGPTGEAEAGLKVKLVPPFPALRQRYLRHRAGVALRGTTRFPSDPGATRGFAPPSGTAERPGGPTVLWQSEAGVARRGTRAAGGARGWQGRCCVYFLLLVHFGFCVGGSCEQKGDGKSVVQEQRVLSNT